jgi:phage-related protein
MGEAGDVLQVIWKGTDGFISTIGTLFTDILGGITSGSVDVIHSITDGDRGMVADTTGILSSGLSHIMMIVNNILQWAALFALLGKAFGRELGRRFWNSFPNRKDTRMPPVPAAHA